MRRLVLHNFKHVLTAMWFTIVRDSETQRLTFGYGLIAAGVAVAVITVVNGLGTKLKTTFSSISTSLQ
jgi:hypothetical protein